MTTPHIPARYDHVGSFLRPAYLLEAREQKAKGKKSNVADLSFHAHMYYVMDGFGTFISLRMIWVAKASMGHSLCLSG